MSNEAENPFPRELNAPEVCSTRVFREPYCMDDKMIGEDTPRFYGTLKLTRHEDFEEDPDGRPMKVKDYWWPSSVTIRDCFQDGAELEIPPNRLDDLLAVLQTIRAEIQECEECWREEPLQAWDVILGGKVIDTVFCDPRDDGATVLDSLVNHDGYDPGISVRRV